MHESTHMHVSSILGLGDGTFCPSTLSFTEKHSKLPPITHSCQQQLAWIWMMKIVLLCHHPCATNKKEDNAAPQSQNVCNNLPALHDKLVFWPDPRLNMHVCSDVNSSLRCIWMMKDTFLCCLIHSRYTWKKFSSLDI